MSRFFVDEKSSGVSFRVLSGLNSPIFTIDIITGKCDNPCNWVIHQNKEREAILAFSPNLEKRTETTRRLWGERKTKARNE
jgi:hypothetical protein